MGRYLVSLTCPGGGTWEDMQKGEPLWEQTLSEYKDITWLHEYDNLSEGRIVCILEAPSADRIRELFGDLGRRIKASELFPDMPETEPPLDIWPIEVEFEGTKVVYKKELAKV